MRYETRVKKQGWSDGGYFTFRRGSDNTKKGKIPVKCRGGLQTSKKRGEGIKKHIGGKAQKRAVCEH